MTPLDVVLHVAHLVTTAYAALLAIRLQQIAMDAHAAAQITDGAPVTRIGKVQPQSTATDVQPCHDDNEFSDDDSTPTADPKASPGAMDPQVVGDTEEKTFGKRISDAST